MFAVFRAVEENSGVQPNVVSYTEAIKAGALCVALLGPRTKNTNGGVYL